MSFLTRYRFRLSELKRTFIGYDRFSQYGEDQVIAKLLPQATGIYVDVGAHHPFRYSNTYLLHKKGWSGVNIDPNPYTIELFKKHRPHDLNIEAAVGKERRSLTYYRFSDPAVNSFHKEAADEWKKKKFLTFLGTTEVPVRPLSELLAGVEKIDFLNIDVEGMDREVLETLDWAKYSPKVIAAEGNHEEFLREKGYRLEKTCGITGIYARIA